MEEGEKDTAVLTEMLHRLSHDLQRGMEKSAYGGSHGEYL